MKRVMQPCYIRDILLFICDRGRKSARHTSIHPKVDRNIDIFIERCFNGRSFKSIAEDYNISVSRTMQACRWVESTLYNSLDLFKQLNFIKE